MKLDLDDGTDAALVPTITAPSGSRRATTKKGGLSTALVIPTR